MRALAAPSDRVGAAGRQALLKAKELIIGGRFSTPRVKRNKLTVGNTHLGQAFQCKW